MAEHNNVRLRQAQRAFGDPRCSREMHETVMEEFNLEIRENSALRNRSLVLSALAGLISAAGVLGGMGRALQTGHSGRSSGNGSALQMALSGQLIVRAIAGGAAVAYTACRALVFERVVYDIELNREVWEIENHLTGEIQEMVAIYKAQGFSEEDALMVTRVFAKQKTAFANLMMVEELGYSRLEPPSGREAIVDAALPAAIGYTLGWLVPLLPLTLMRLSAARRQTVGLCTLTAGCIAVSVAQSEVFYGGYASPRKALRVTIWNVSAAGIIFAAARIASRLFQSD